MFLWYLQYCTHKCFLTCYSNLICKNAKNLNIDVCQIFWHAEKALLLFTSWNKTMRVTILFFAIDLVQLASWVWNHISHAYLTITADEHIPNARIPVKLNLMNKRERLLLYFTYIQSEMLPLIWLWIHMKCVTKLGMMKVESKVVAIKRTFTSWDNLHGHPTM